jgi:putative chitinase
MLTLQQFSNIIPTNRNPKPWFDASQELFEKYQINTPLRIAGFMAQCAHESNDFNSLEENLNYSEDALNRVFSRYFGKGKRNAAEYARKPEKIANYVYQDEFRSKAGALGNTQPGDGWRFRGRGIKQLTGRNNYAAFGKTVGMTAEQAADYVATPKGAIESACWFWSTRKLNAVADADDIVRMTKIINGGDIGLADRKARYTKAKTILGGLKSNKSMPKPVNQQITDSVTQSKNLEIKRGSRGELVKQVQKALKLSDDGIFGIQTEVAVKSWQRINRYTVNGILNQEQINKLTRK